MIKKQYFYYFHDETEVSEQYLDEISKIYDRLLSVLHLSMIKIQDSLGEKCDYINFQHYGGGALRSHYGNEKRIISFS